MKTYYVFAMMLFNFAAVVSGGCALLFAGLGFGRDASFFAIVAVLCGLVALCEKKIGQGFNRNRG